MNSALPLVWLILYLVRLGLMSSMYVVDKTSPSYAKEEVLNVDGLDLNKSEAFTLYQGWNFSGCSTYDQKMMIIKATKLVARLGLDQQKWNRTKFILSKYTMVGESWANISKRFYPPKDSSVAVSFTLITDGYTQQHEDNAFIKTNIHLKLRIRDGAGQVLDSVDLETLKPTNFHWKSYSVQLRKSTIASEPWLVEFNMFRPSEEHHIFISNVSIAWYPIIGENITRDSVPETSTAAASTSTTGNLTNLTTASSNFTKHTTASVFNSTATPNITTSSTTTKLNVTISTLTSAASSTSYLETSTHSNSHHNGTEALSNHDAGAGAIGLPGEVVLIVLVVVLSISILVLVAKYFLLQKHIGDYRVNHPAQYSNPSYHETYRDH